MIIARCTYYDAIASWLYDNMATALLLWMPFRNGIPACNKKRWNLRDLSASGCRKMSLIADEYIKRYDARTPATTPESHANGRLSWQRRRWNESIQSWISGPHSIRRPREETIVMTNTNHIIPIEILIINVHARTEIHNIYIYICVCVCVCVDIAYIHIGLHAYWI